MEIIIFGIAALIASAVFYLFFILLLLVRRFGNRTLWALALRFARPVLREFYSYDLAEGANKVLQAQPDTVHLKALADRQWRDKAGVEERRAALAELGFTEAGLYGLDALPGTALLFMVHGDSGAGACVAEHPLSGVWTDLVLMYSADKGVTMSSLPDPGLPARMRRPGSRSGYFPGADAAALYDRLMAARGPEKPLPFTVENIAVRFEEAWALDTDWRKQHEFTPEEALAMKRGRALPPETVKTGRLFDLAGGGLVIANFAALVVFLIAARGYAPVGNGPWLEALRWCALPAGLLALVFAVSIQATGPAMRLVAGIFMAVVAYPFFWGSFYMGGTWYNGAHDAGQAVVRRAVVHGKNATGRRERDYYVSLASWAPGRDSEKIRVSEEQYDGIIPGRTAALVTVRSGRLGHEWIASLAFETSPAP